MTELEMIENAQNALGDLKKSLRDIEVVNREAGRHMAANAAMGLRGELIAFHAKATELLALHYPQDVDGIAAKGGGGR